LASILKRCGYRFINIGSGFGPTGWNPYADANLEGSWLSDPIFMILQRTSVGMFCRSQLIDELRNVRLQEFVNLNNSIRMPGPKFVFMHVLLPHPPYFFDDKGHHLCPEGGEADWTLSETKSHKRYVEQALYTVGRMREFVSNLKTNAKKPYIVIFHGDHGSATSGSLYDAPSDTYVKERMGIFEAVLFPGIDAARISDSLTPVNISRILFDSYFAATFPLLPDKSYMSNYTAPFNFTDVTHKVRWN
jgi:hypothetical protein